MSSSPVFTIIELSGHIIDSLTLGKVIDKVQAAGCRYQINDFQIGEKKNDFSYAQISLWMDSQEAIDALLKELRTYGAFPVANNPARLEPCPEDGMMPKGAYARLNPPIEIFLEGAWIPVERKGDNLVIVVDPASRTASFRKISELKKGDLVVIGNTGVKVLPTLGETAHAQPVAG